MNTKPAAEATATCMDVGPKGLQWLKEQMGAHPNITSLHCQCFLQRVPGLWEQLLPFTEPGLKPLLQSKAVFGGQVCSL